MSRQTNYLTKSKLCFVIASVFYECAMTFKVLNVMSLCCCIGCIKECIPSSRSHVTFNYMLGFHTAELLGHHQTLKLKIHTLLAVPNYLFSIFVAIINAWRLSSLPAT